MGGRAQPGSSSLSWADLFRPQSSVAAGSCVGLSCLLAGVTRRPQLFLPVFSIMRFVLGFSSERPEMMATVASQGRLLSLKASEWSVLLASVAFCGIS